MAPMYLGRWIFFYMEINDQCGCTKVRRKFEDETHSEEIPSECVRCKSVPPS
jgi:hypothetical protein